MERICLKARAKINIALDVTAKREDGYHEMRMIMQSLAFHDRLSIKKVNKQNYLKLITNLAWLPTDERNLVYRAARYLLDMFDVSGGVFIELEKNIPVSAGLAGGSSDCAAVLIGLRNLLKLPLSNDELMEIGKRFGADVPFCMMRGTVLAEGIGERLTSLPPMPQTYVLLVKPSFSVSTRDVFKRFKLENVTEHPDIEKIIYHIVKGNIRGVCEEMCNVLETVTAVKYPIINQIKTVMRDNGAIGCLMSGSGPSVFGFFETKHAALSASNVIKSAFPRLENVYVTQTFAVSAHPTISI